MSVLSLLLNQSALCYFGTGVQILSHTFSILLLTIGYHSLLRVRAEFYLGVPGLMN